jgi:hypothetical protein
MDFKGIKQQGASRYDLVQIHAVGDGIEITSFDGFYKKRSSAVASPATARKIAAELTRLADEMEGK